VPPGLKGHSVTFRAPGKTTVDRKAPFASTFVRQTKSPVVTATAVVTVGVVRAAISGRLVVHCS
jgi:hypothetical protein